MESMLCLMKYFEEGCLSSTAVERIQNELIIKASKELELLIGRLDSELSLLQDFLSSLQYLVKHNNSCYSHLTEQGILQLMKVVFVQILGRVSRDGPSESLQAVIELCTDTSNALADINTKAKSGVVLELCPHFLDLLQSHLLGFTTRMEVLKSTNMLLEQCPTTVKENLLNTKDNIRKISGIVSLIKTVGDYEFQVGIIECLMRLFPRKSRCHFAEKFIFDQDLLDGFMAIKDKDFETDCRLFLNTVNAQSEDPSEGVFSLPCVSAFVGNKQLRKPSDGGYEEFWVDFNIGSERLTLFCEQDSLCSQGTQLDEDLWETVAVYKIDVEQCCFNEKDSLIELELCLKSPVCEIYPSQHQDVTDNKIRVSFMPELEAHLTHAAGYTFNFSEKKSKVSTVRTPLQISMKDVQNADSQSKGKYAVHSSVMPSPARTGSQESISKRHKVSVPSVPMKTPAASPMDTPSCAGQQVAKQVTKPVTENDNPCVEKMGSQFKVSASINNNSRDKIVSKDTSRDFAVPRTPQRKTRSKVKIPVVTVTPPAQEKRTQTSQSAKLRDEKVTIKNIPYENKHQHLVIPDSLPLIEARQSKPDIPRTVNASISKENGLEDSGTVVDESRSSNYSTAICDAPDTSKENKMLGKKDAECKHDLKEADKDETSVKKVKGKTSKNKVSGNLINEFKVQRKAGVDEITRTEKIETLEKTSNLVCGKNKNETKKNPENKRASLEAANFGFDSLTMDEELDTVPDSLEIPLSDILPPNQTDTCNLESNSKGKKSKTGRKGKIPDTESMSELDSKKKNVQKTREKKAQVQKKKEKKTFCGADSSLKELNELGSQKDNEVKLGPIKDNVAGEHRKSKTQGIDERYKTLRNVYTFLDPVIAKLKGTQKNPLSLEKRKKISKKKGSGLGKNKKLDRPEQGKSENAHDSLNDDNKIDLNTVSIVYDVGNKKSLSKRGRYSKEIENTDDTDGISTPSLSAGSESKKGSDQPLSASESPLPVRETPENSPDKVTVNKHQIKSSLKKDRRSADSAIERQSCERKSRVSFDLPNTASQEKDSVPIKKSEVTGPENQESNIDKNEIETIHLNTTDKVLQDETADMNGSSVSGAVNETGCKIISSTAKRRSKCKDAKCNEMLVKREDNISKKFIATKVNSPQKVASSPVSSLASTDSLYIESDDSYNARRYKMENRTWSKAKQRRKSSLNMKNKDSKVPCNSKKEFSWKNKDKLDSFKDISVQPDSPLISNIYEYREKHKKSGKSTKQYADDKKESKHVAVAEILKVRDKDIDIQLEQFKKVSGEPESTRTTRKAILHRTVVNNDDNGACIEEIDRQEFNHSNGMLQRSESPVTDEDEKFGLKMEMEGKKSRKADKKLSINEKNKHKESIDDSGTHSAVVLPYNFQNINEEEFNENKTDRKDKRSSKSIRKNLSYTRKSFEKIECENGYAVSEHSFQTIADARFKKMVFQMSYLKSKSNLRSKRIINKSKRNNKKDQAKGTAYDPYDFESQCENASVASERIDRKDISKELNSRHRKIDKKYVSEKKAYGAKCVKNVDSPLNHQESFITEADDEGKDENNSCETSQEMIVNMCRENFLSKKHKHKLSQKGITDGDSQEGNYVPDSSLQELMIDLEDEHEKPKKSTMVQDKKTNRWYRANADTVEEKKNVCTKNQTSPKKLQKKEKRTSADFPTVDSFNTRSVYQSPSMGDDAIIIDSSVEESSINQFSKILKEITACQGKFDTNFTSNICDELEVNDTKVKTPCIIGSMSSTPKVGSGKRKHYYPLNISVIKTPQSCNIKDSGSDEEAVSGKNSQTEKKTRKKKTVKYKELSDSDTEDERSVCKSRKSTDSISILDNSQTVSNKSEKSWILEKKKTPKLKKPAKTYKGNKKLKSGTEQNLCDSSQSEDSMEDESRDTGNNKMEEFLQNMEDSPLTIPSLSLNTPAVTPSIKFLWSLEADDDVLTQASQNMCNKKKIKKEDDDEFEESQENATHTLALMESCQNTNEESFDSGSGSDLGIKSLDKSVQSDVREEKSVHKLLQENMKLLLGDSGFASGPSSEVRPTRSSLKRKFPNIEERSIAISTSSSQAESEDEIEKSIFVPKKLFKFDPAENTPQLPSLYSDVTEENDVDFVFQSGLSTVMAAFGADIQSHLKSRKQKIETFTKRTLKETQKHFHQTLVEQQKFQSNLTDEFGARMLLEVAALEKDIQRLTDAERKMEDFYKSQLDVLKSNEESQKKRLSNLKKIQSSFLDKTWKMNKYNLNVHKNMKDQLKKDITDLQRKLMAETQRQEFMDVRTKLQRMF